MILNARLAAAIIAFAATALAAPAIVDNSATASKKLDDVTITSTPAPTIIYSQSTATETASVTTLPQSTLTEMLPPTTVTTTQMSTSNAPVVTTTFVQVSTITATLPSTTFIPESVTVTSISTVETTTVQSVTHIVVPTTTTVTAEPTATDGAITDLKQYALMMQAFKVLSERRASYMSKYFEWDTINPLVDEINERLIDTECQTIDKLGRITRQDCIYSSVNCALDLSCAPQPKGLAPPKN